MAHHIAVLDADAPIPSFYATHGLYSSRFRTLLQDAAARLHPSLSIHTTAYDVVGGSLPPFELLAPRPSTGKVTTTNNNNNGNNGSIFNHIDSILITGSARSAYETTEFPWIAKLQSFIQTVHTQYKHIKFFGSCFGHQIIAQAILPECKVEACPSGFEIGIEPICLSEEFKDAFPVLKKDPAVGKGFRIQLIHGDRVVPAITPASNRETNGIDVERRKDEAAALPNGWINMGTTPKCPIQGFYFPGRVLTYQGHFEFDIVANRDLCVTFGGRLGWSSAEIEEFVKQIERGQGERVDEDEDDSRVAADVVMMFFMGT